MSEPADECSIGAALTAQESGLGVPLAAFSGQMGCIYLFEDVLSPGKPAFQQNSGKHPTSCICAALQFLRVVIFWPWH